MAPQPAMKAPMTPTQAARVKQRMYNLQSTALDFATTLQDGRTFDLRQSHSLR
jgi:hypothetical protein